MKNKKLYYRWLLLIVGSILMGLGSQIAIETKFGADSVAMIWIGLSKTFGWTLGTANNVFSITFLIIVLILDWHYIGLGTIISPLIESCVVDILPSGYLSKSCFIIKLIFMLNGIVILSIGCGMYSAANLGCGTFIGTVFSIHERLNWKVSIVMFTLESLLLVLAFFLGAPLTIGPIINTILSGPIVEKTVKTINNL